MKRPSLLDPTFRYTPSVETDLHKTFARIRREQREAAKIRRDIAEGDTATIIEVFAKRRGK